MKYTINEIINFVEKYTKKNVLPNTDIHKDLGIDGDYFFELIDDYSKTFNVDVSNYLWYFHQRDDDEPLISFFKPPNKKVTRIPITPLILLEFADKGYWDVKYPPFNKSKIEKRYDTHNFFILLILPIFIAFLFVVIKILFK